MSLQRISMGHEKPKSALLHIIFPFKIEKNGIDILILLKK